MSGTETIKGVKWFYRLVASSEQPNRNYLLGKLSPDLLDHGLIICYTPGYINGRSALSKEGKPNKLFAFFQDYTEFFQYMGLFRPEQRFFYEVVLGELPQKPHFDLDIAQDKFQELYPDLDWQKESWNIVQTLIQSIQIELPIDITKDVLIYDSNSETKVSYHIIINNHCHTDNKEAEAFYKAVMIHFYRLTNGIYKDTKFIDPCVYKSIQQFRLIGSQKYQSNRIKQFHSGFYLADKLYYHEYTENITANPELINLIIFRESLISFVSGCKYIKTYIQPNSQYLVTSQFTDVQLDNVSVEGIYNMVRDYMCGLEFEVAHHGLVRMVRFPYTVREVKGGQIFLRRTASAWCPLCKQRDMHTAEGSVIRIIGSRVTWKCFRYTGPSMFIGYGEDLIPTQNIQQIEEDDGPSGFCFGDILLSCDPNQAPQEYCVPKESEEPKDSLQQCSQATPVEVAQISKVIDPPKPVINQPKVIPQIVYLPRPPSVVDRPKSIVSPLDKLRQESQQQRKIFKPEPKPVSLHMIDTNKPLTQDKSRRTKAKLQPMANWSVSEF